MRKLGFVGAAMRIMAKFLDKGLNVAPDLTAKNIPQSRKDLRAAKRRNRLRYTQANHKHYHGVAGTKLLKQFDNGTATQRHPG